jgi:outer membrane protein
MPRDPRLLKLWLPFVLCIASSIPARAAPTAGPPPAAQPMAPASEALGIPVARKISLAEALAYARAHQPAVLAALARVRQEKANAEVPRAQYYPLIGVTGQLLGGTTNNTTASYLTTPFVELPRIGGTPSATADSATWRPRASTLAAVGGNQEIFDFGRIAAEAAAADALTAVAGHSAAAVDLDIELNVEESYYAVHAAKGIFQASEDAYERSLVHRDFARAGVKSGLRSPIELTRAEADLSRFDTGRIRARGGVAAAEAVLAAAVGWPELALDASDEAPTPASMPALSDAIQLANQKDPRLQEALARLRAQELETRAIGALLRPDIQLSAALSGRAGGAIPSSGPGDETSGSGFVPNVPNWDAALVLSWPLLDPTINARQRASRAAEEVQRAQIDFVRQQVVAAVERAYVDVAVSRDALPSLQHELEAARANYAQADARFKAGLGTSVELADAEALRTDAEIRLALGTFELAKARSAFARAIAESL